MRVIAGELEGQPLVAPRGWKVRPTSDRVREAIFSALGERVDGARVLDLYCGTGALAIEALSRGAAAALSWSTAIRGRRSATSSASGSASGPSWSAPRSAAGWQARAGESGELRPRLRRCPL